MPLDRQHELVELLPDARLGVAVSKIPQGDFETVERPRQGESRRLIGLLHVAMSYKAHAVRLLRSPAQECPSAGAVFEHPGDGSDRCYQSVGL